MICSFSSVTERVTAACIELDLRNSVLKTMGAMTDIDLELSKVIKWSKTVFMFLRCCVMLA